MPLSLADAALRCAGRGLARAAARHRAGAISALAVLLLGLAAGTASGVALADTLAPALGDPLVARSLVAGVGFACLASGAALGAALPGEAALGAQLAAAPARAFDRACAVLGPAAALLVGGALCVTLPLAAPVVASAPGGRPAVLSLLVAIAACCLAGGALGRVLAVGLLDRRTAGGAALALAVTAPLPVIVTLHTGDVVAGRASALASTVLAGVCCAIALVVWGAGALRPARPAAAHGRSRDLPSGALRATRRAAVLVLTRRADLRASLAGATVLGCSGLGISALAGAPTASGLLLGATGAALAAAPCSLAIGGVLADGAYVWRTTACGPAVPALAWSSAALLGLAPCALVAVIATGLGARGPHDLAVAVGIALCTCAAGLVVGCLLPWRRTGMADQALAIAALGVVLGAVSLAASRVGPTLVAQGLPPWVVGTSIVALVALVGTGAVVARVGGSP